MPLKPTKVNPPLRTAADAAALIEGVKDGTVDAIVTDHAPHAAWEKAREFELAPFGMTGPRRAFGLVLTNLVEPGIIDLSDMVDLMAVAPRDILGLEPVKIAEGSVADITVFDPSVRMDRGRRRLLLEGAQFRLRRMRAQRAARSTCSLVAKQRFATALSSNSKHVRGRNRGSLAYDIVGRACAFALVCIMK